jgi:hypothetical protein
MIFFHKPYYNPNYTNPDKNIPNGICPKPKKIYKLYKLYNAKFKFFKEHRKKIRNQNLKVLNYKYFCEKEIIFKNNQIIFVQNQKRRYVFYLCVIFAT